MDAFITGEIEHTIDSSNRLFISRKLRNQMGSDEVSTAAYLVPGANGVLCLYAENSYKRYLASLKSAEAGNAVAYERMIYALTIKCELDKSGRIQFTDRIRQRYRLSENLTLIGAGDHIEIWNSDDWDSYLRKHFKLFQQQVEAARGKVFDASVGSLEDLEAIGKSDDRKN